MIKNIIFDFGDVFINLDKFAPFKELKKHNIHALSEEDNEVLLKYEVGGMTTNEVLTYFSEAYPLNKNQFKSIWNMMLLDFPDYRMSWLQELAASKEYRLFLLSNTNDMHISWIKEDWGHELYTSFKACFEKFYLSHEIQLRKPNHNIYEYVLNENQLKAEETFFIDDTLNNTQAAEQLGIRTWNIDPQSEDIIHLKSKLPV
ncbi:MAG: haloacid dehalogenase [Flavobacteriaceae bacterium]|nr:haloacid dehalogenase [Flavobacteriaceae bacterium]|tara:strand:+ start:39021 stop:39626 length:606 start_codon:yes stop_codon:yes gene_type:complete